jgi:mono/diheme cytochrome c family protein
MKPVLKAIAILAGLAVLVGLAVVGYILTVGLSTRAEPTAIEKFVARRVRQVAVARWARGLTNPITASAEAIADGRDHYADHCASCHANDGSGNTEMGRGLFPKAPDMRLAATQNLSDGELFWIIENGIRFTGMPGWATGTKEGEQASWRLVHFIRRLPKLTPEEILEMEALNPRSPDEIRRELEQERFLEGGDVTPATPAPPKHEHGAGHD